MGFWTAWLNNQHLRDARFEAFFHFGNGFPSTLPKTNNRKNHGKTRKKPPLEDVSPTKKGYFPLPC